ncbi:sodium- and chloride-dependent transporter XTRP3-like isoform X1 [Pristis pectinata]|uniref:sodium- and chloride-dependent transporter XTRP3-like isoform X1 n=1 Tax=Pristis pectinata TaxID=685728 RepID=UPI00223E486A|nr:sodium- and chloride-dependent transporter XTRP3-like isoform X1 [Pristis pectinata]
MEDGRPSWDNPMQFIFACISFAVGLSNVWRFPYLCQMHGGGGFLIPYVIMLVAAGLPLFYLELALGQLMRKGSIGAWRAVSPYLIGVGAGSLVIAFLVSVYYNAINSWSLWYLFHSFENPLPWASCPLNRNNTGLIEECAKSSATEYFWYRKTLNISPSINDTGIIHWGMILCLILSWLVVYICIIRGTESTGKVVYVTTCFPYVVLLIYLIRGLTLHGAKNGLLYMFTPKIEQLTDPKSWIDAATQIFYSLGLGFGSLIAFASFNEKNNNCEIQAVIIALINSLTSVFASIVTFAIYGFKATYNYESCIERMILLLTNTFDLEETAITSDTLDKWTAHLNSTAPDKFATISSQIETCDLQSHLDTAAEGTGLIFIVYTEAIVHMPGPSQIWSILYFSMVLVLGIGSMLGNMAGVITPLSDMKIISKYLPRELMIGITCLMACGTGMIFSTEAGNYWFVIFNDYAATLALLLIVLIEIIGVCYIHGIRRFLGEIEMMVGRKPNLYWIVTWVFISPALIVSLLIFYVVDYITSGRLSYIAWDSSEGRSVTLEYPTYALAVIGLLVVASISCIPLMAIVVYIRKQLKK